MPVPIDRLLEFDREQAGRAIALASGAKAIGTLARNPDIQVSVDASRFPAITRIGRRRSRGAFVSVVEGDVSSHVSGILAGTAPGGQVPAVGYSLFGDTPNEIGRQLQVDAVDTIATILAGLVRSPEDGLLPELEATRILGLAIGADIVSRTAREQLLDRRVPTPGDVPPDLIDLGDRLRHSQCFGALSDAIRDHVVAGNAATLRPNPSYLISRISPADACRGAKIVIEGRGFGPQTGEMLVTFAAVTGTAVVSCLPVAIGRIEVTVPASATAGFVSLYDTSSITAVGTLGDASSGLVNALAECLGAVGSAQLEPLRERLSVPTLAGPVYGGIWFAGGFPVVRSFTVEGRSSIEARPRQTVELSWHVDGAARVSITPIGVGVKPPPATGSLDSTGHGRVRVRLPGGSWTGGYQLEARTGCGAATAAVSVSVRDKIAFALGGGGARGDFQLGALKYLAEKGVKPDVLATTSVGSVNGLKLAHGNAAGQPTAQEDLESIWLNDLRRGDSMFVPGELIIEVKRLLGNLPAMAGVLIGSGPGLPVFGPIGLVGLLISAGVAVGDVKDFLETLLNRFSGSPPAITGLFSLSPIEALMNTKVDPVAVRTSGIELRMVAVSLDTAGIVAVDERGRVWAEGGDHLELTSETVSLVDGAMASSSMPTIFEARQVGSHTCVDGGVRDVIPVQIAIDDLGATEVYALVCSAPVQPLTVGTARGMGGLQIFGRAVTDITFEELANDDIAPHGGWPADVPVHVIRPSFNVHDTMVVEPGLIRIALDYGWMRAADVLDGPPRWEARAKVACDRLIRARTRCWELEHSVFDHSFLDPNRGIDAQLFGGGRVAPDFGGYAISWLRQAKREVFDACQERRQIGGKLPAGYSMWWTDWEFHGNPPAFGWTPSTPSPWAAQAGYMWTESAATAPIEV